MRVVVLVLLGVAAVWIFFLSSFLGTTRRSTHPAYFILGDTSTDTTPGKRQRAQLILGQAIAQAREEQGFVAATPFQHDARSRAEWHHVSFDVPERLTKKTGGTKEHLEKERRRFSEETKELFQHPSPIEGTDIIGILISTKQQFSLFPNADSRTIILVSNMANVDYDEGGLILKRPYAPEEIRTILSDLQAKDQVPDLSGVCVYIVGSGEIPKEHVQNRVQVSIEQFWTEYFDLAGALPPIWTSGLHWPLSCGH